MGRWESELGGEASMGFGTDCNLGVSGTPLKDQGLRRVNPCLLLKTNLSSRRCRYSSLLEGTSPKRVRMVLGSLLRTTWKALLSPGGSPHFRRHGRPSGYLCPSAHTVHGFPEPLRKFLGIHPFLEKMARHCQNSLAPFEDVLEHIRRTSPPGGFTKKTLTILWMVRFMLLGWNPYGKFTLPVSFL
jgi:hypothetical protein